MATVKIGSKSYEVPELNFSALERAWPYINEATTNPDPMVGVSAAIHVIAAGIIEADHFIPGDFGITSAELSSTVGTEDQHFQLVAKFLKKKTRATEISGIRQAVLDIAREAGLETTEGEPDKEGEEETPNPSMETAAVLSPS